MTTTTQKTDRDKATTAITETPFDGDSITGDIEEIRRQIVRLTSEIGLKEQELFILQASLAGEIQA